MTNTFIGVGVLSLLMLSVMCSKHKVNLLKAFHIVLLIDTTYKTNKYRFLLLEIVGVTSTALTFSIVFVFLSSERENNFIWALEN